MKTSKSVEFTARIRMPRSVLKEKIEGEYREMLLANRRAEYGLGRRIAELETSVRVLMEQVLLRSSEAPAIKSEEKAV